MNQNQNIPTDCYNSFFCSFEIVSLHTNIPLDETIIICADILYCSHLDPLPIPVNVFLRLMHIAIKCVQFSFNNTMYQQVDGIGMDSPLWVALVNILLVFRREHCSKAPTNQYFFKWYIDDTFVIFSSRSKSRHFFHTVNQLHQALMFTCKFVNNNSKVFTNGPGDLGSIPGRVIPKTQKMILDVSLLNTQHCKVRFKGKGEQSSERSSALPYTLM